MGGVAHGSVDGRRPLIESDATAKADSANFGRRRAVLIGATAVMILGAAAFTVVQLVGRSGSPGADSRRRAAVDSVTLEVFPNFPIQDGDTQPWKHPNTGQRTVYAAEPCFWTSEGGVKAEPTWVLLNSYADKPEPTLCPDCRRIVTAHNPMPPLELFEAKSDR
jgi:hypothetical protein